MFFTLNNRGDIEKRSIDFLNQLGINDKPPNGQGDLSPFPREQRIPVPRRPFYPSGVFDDDDGTFYPDPGFEILPNTISGNDKPFYPGWEKLPSTDTGDDDWSIDPIDIQDDDDFTIDSIDKNELEEALRAFMEDLKTANGEPPKDSPDAAKGWPGETEGIPDSSLPNNAVMSPGGNTAPENAILKYGEDGPKAIEENDPLPTQRNKNDWNSFQQDKSPVGALRRRNFIGNDVFDMDLANFPLYNKNNSFQNDAFGKVRYGYAGGGGGGSGGGGGGSWGDENAEDDGNEEESADQSSVWAGAGLGGQSSGGGGGSFTADSDSLYAHEECLIKQITWTDPKFDSQLDSFKEQYEINKPVYESIAQQTGLPPELVAAIHYRENTSMDLTKSMQDGANSLPEGISFVQDAVNVINRELNKFKTYQGRDRISYDINTMLAFAEVWNGVQYYDDQLINPYLFSGTNLYVKGKYDYDGHYNPELVDAQPGLYLIMKKLLG